MNRKNLQTLFLLFLTLCLSLCCVGCGADNGKEAPKETLAPTPYKTIEYEPDEENGGIMLTKYTTDEQDLVLPASIDGQPVVSIGPDVFEYDSITSVVIQEGVVRIHRRAFKNTTLKKATLPSTLKVIDEGAFYSCGLLTDINFPDGLDKIGNSAFYCCSTLSNVVLPGSIKRIVRLSFAACPLLETITYDGVVYPYDEFAEKFYIHG